MGAELSVSRKSRHAEQRSKKLLDRKEREKTLNQYKTEHIRNKHKAIIENALCLLAFSFFDSLSSAPYGGGAYSLYRSMRLC